jgi:hypothetical protein
MVLPNISFISIHNIFIFSLFPYPSYCVYLALHTYAKIVPVFRSQPPPSKSLTTNSIELSPYWKAASGTATEELAKILWNSKVYCRVHKSPPPVPILSQMKPLHTTHPNQSLRFILVLPIHLRFRFPIGLFPSGFRISSFIPHIPLSFYVPCPSHPP